MNSKLSKKTVDINRDMKDLNNNNNSNNKEIKDKTDLNESDEIDRIISQRKLIQNQRKTSLENNQNNYQNQNSFNSNNLNISIDKSLDWLNFFFADNQIKDLYNNFERTRSIIIIECIFYLNFYKNLLNFKGRFNPNFNEKDDNNNLTNKINSAKNNNINEQKEKNNENIFPIIKINNSMIFNQIVTDTINTDLSQIFGDFDNKFEGKIQKNDYSMAPDKYLTSDLGINFKSNRGLTFRDSKRNTLFNKTVNNYYFPNQNSFTVGIIGCGCVGELLAKYLIKIKDSGLINFKLIISTRRPNKVDEDILNLVDNNIEILLDNEKVENIYILFLKIFSYKFLNFFLIKYSFFYFIIGSRGMRLDIFMHSTTSIGFINEGNLPNIIRTNG